MSTSQDFAIETAADGSVVAVKVRGDLDMSTAPALAEALAGTDGNTVTLDLGGVTFLDSSALVVLISSGRDMVGRGGRLRIGPRSDVVAKVLAMTGLDQEAEAFDVLPDPPDGGPEQNRTTT
ncbi:MAG: STAS domain-containing protein [Acidimicrobiales bacterium]|nr:STAS domain-containing protein [Acidimicrobiales bacterium]